jgi:hypothetical protein
MFIETNTAAEPGWQVKVIVDWPVLLEAAVPLQFIALGEVVRRDAFGFGMRFLRYEYRTRRKEVASTTHYDSTPFQMADHFLYFETVRSSRPSTSLI